MKEGGNLDFACKPQLIAFSCVLFSFVGGLAGLLYVIKLIIIFQYIAFSFIKILFDFVKIENKHIRIISRWLIIKK